ncbi:hypothetical protein IQ07DRAFT_647456 [Pyrenochaeta sp. DS3sAY3a]|nr:hypothetical protein IQ07DRAFT_647456 [Pyrenochaeta sp. DS3sAY3a]
MSSFARIPDVPAAERARKRKHAEYMREQEEEEDREWREGGRREGGRREGGRREGGRREEEEDDDVDGDYENDEEEEEEEEEADGDAMRDDIFEVDDEVGDITSYGSQIGEHSEPVNQRAGIPGHFMPDNHDLRLESHSMTMNVSEDEKQKRLKILEERVRGIILHMVLTAQYCLSLYTADTDKDRRPMCNRIMFWLCLKYVGQDCGF